VPTRRAFILASLAAAVAPALPALGAELDLVLDCATYMLHEVAGPELSNLVAANLAAGRRPVTVGEVGDMLLGRVPAPDEPLFCLTFDDRLLSQYVNALPVLQRFQIPATFFVMGTSWPGDRVHAYMTTAQVRELAKVAEIGSHTIDHDPNMLALRARDPGGYRWEIEGSRAELTVLTGQPITPFASPASVYDAAMIADVTAAGYETAVMTWPDQQRVPTRLTPADRYRIPRRRVT
jgi:peptidoglycan/xylan/chitin deacetylase (PgdA/CDA1 family)